jgi:hypothetical protein
MSYKGPSRKPEASRGSPIKPTWCTESGWSEFRYKNLELITKKKEELNIKIKNTNDVLLKWVFIKQLKELTDHENQLWQNYFRELYAKDQEQEQEDPD